MKGTRSVSNFTFFACGCLIVTTPFVEKILSPLSFLCSFVKDKLTTCMGLYLGSILFHWSILYSFTGITSSSSVLPTLFFLNIVLTMLGLLPSWLSKSHDQPRQHIKRRKAMTNLGSILKSRDITLMTKIRVVRAMVFPIVMYGCESWTVKKAEHQRIYAFELWCWRRLLRLPWTERRSN